ncbi:MAG: LysR family transcriptional regulator [Paracoccaceae bacterium]
MAELSETELRRLDLTLLLVFLGLLRHRKAARVADDLGLTQSAISQALRRLRDIFNDELFLRRPHGFEPTAVALALEPPITRAVDTLRQALGESRKFNPAQDAGVVRIAALDAEQVTLIPPLIERVQRFAPGLSLSVVSIARDAAMAALDTGEVDLALGYFWNIPENIDTTPLYTEAFRVVARPDLVAGPLTLEHYLDLPHILVSPVGDLHGIVDSVLAEQGKSRRVIMSLPAFLPALAATARIGALCTVPMRVAKAQGLTIHPPPLDVRQFPVSAALHRRNAKHGRLQWILSQVKRISAA